MLADTGQGVYQWVYTGSMVSMLVFGILKGFTFTKTTLMASSSLHDQVFDKVLPGSGARDGLVGPQDSPNTRSAPDAELGSGDGHGSRGTPRCVWEESPNI